MSDTRIAGGIKRISKMLEDRNARIAELETERDRYRNALGLYGWHRSACKFWPSNAGDEEANCNCGLHQLLEAPKS